MKKLQKIFTQMIGMYLDSPEEFKNNPNEIVFSLSIKLSEIKHCKKYNKAKAKVSAFNTEKEMQIRIHKSISKTELSFKLTRAELIQLVHHILIAHSSYNGIKHRFSNVSTFKEVKNLLKETFNRIQCGYGHLCLYPFGKGIGACFLVSSARAPEARTG